MNKLEKEILSNEELKEIYLKLSPRGKEMNILTIYNYMLANNECMKCLGKKKCQLEPQKMQNIIECENDKVKTKLIPCKYVEHINDELLEYLFFPFDMEIGDPIKTANRTEVGGLMYKFEQNPNGKGIYLCGPFGCGKTYLLIRLAKRLIKLNKKVIFAYYPDLVRHIKSEITTGTMEKTISKLKTIDILMLDDVGAEVNSSFIRDEFLGPILQYRMMSHLPTFMSSNLDIENLKRHLMETKDEVNKVNCDRIIERIESLMNIVELSDINYRRELN